MRLTLTYLAECKKHFTLFTKQRNIQVARDAEQRLPCCRPGEHFRSPLHWRHNDRGGVSDHQPHDCLLNRSFRRRSKKTSKLRVTGLCAGNSPATGELPAQRASNSENVSIWWRLHGSTQPGDRSTHEVFIYVYNYYKSWPGADTIHLICTDQQSKYWQSHRSSNNSPIQLHSRRPCNLRRLTDR